MVKLGFLVGLLVLLTMTAFARDVQMVVINGHRMVSLRTFGETFGATIDYDNSRDGVCISLDRNNNSNVNSDQRPNSDWRQGGNNSLPRSTDRNNNTYNDRNNGSYDRNNNSNANSDQRPNSDWRQGGNNNLPPRLDSGSRPRNTPRQYNDSTPARHPGTAQERDTTRDPARQDNRYQAGSKTPREKQSIKDQKKSKTQQADKKKQDDNKGRKDN